MHWFDDVPRRPGLYFVEIDGVVSTMWVGDEERPSPFDARIVRNWKRLRFGELIAGLDYIQQLESKLCPEQVAYVPTVRTVKLTESISHTLNEPEPARGLPDIVGEGVTFLISKEFHFSASHQLGYLGPDHPCGRLHGHNYRVILYLRSRVLDDQGMVVDYGELDRIAKWIRENFDHRHLNEALQKLGWDTGLDVDQVHSTAERIAAIILHSWVGIFPALHAVEVCETPKTRARAEVR